MKIINKEKARKDPYVYKNLRREGRLLQRGHHKHVIGIYDTLGLSNISPVCGLTFLANCIMLARICRKMASDFLTVFLETENNYYLITELISGGEMIDMVEGSRGLPESQVRRYITQILSALQHLHRNGLVHRFVHTISRYLLRTGSKKFG